MSASSRRRRVNWFQLLVDLKRHNVTAYDVERMLDVSRTTVLRWGQGSEPRHDDGELLLELWCRLTGRSKDEAPRIRLYVAI